MADSKQIEIEVITPDRKVLEGVADQVVIPAHDGELGVLNLRAPLMCELGIGRLRYTTGGTSRQMFVDGGFAQVLQNRVIVLTSRALPAEEVTADVIQEAQEAADAHEGTDADTQSARQRDQQRVSVLRRLQSGG
jgi:F-type H+-transporting ATPase subunit epsilon